MPSTERIDKWNAFKIILDYTLIMSSPQIFNIENLLHFTENDRLLSAQLLTMALQDIPDFLQRALDQIDHGNYGSAASWVHKIKGIAGTIGAEHLFDLSVSAESELKMNEPLSSGSTVVDELTEAARVFCRDQNVLDWISDA